MTKKIPLSGKRGQGKFALVDDEDYEELIKDRWFLDVKGYCYKNTYKEDGKRTSMKMHRQIMNAPSNMQVDHINNDGKESRIDNRKQNLRLTTNQYNSYNRNKYKRNDVTSKYKGVKLEGRQKNYWVAFIKVEGKQKYLGHFITEESAAHAYNIAAEEYHAEYALFNDVPVVDLEEYRYKPNTSSKYKGVSYNKSSGKYFAYVRHNKKQKSLGYHLTELEAATVRDKYIIDNNLNLKLNFEENDEMTQLIKLEQPNCRPCSEVSKFLANNGVTYTTYDVTEKPEVAAEYGVMSVPVTILLDDNGKELQRSIGCNYGELEEMINKL
ncbi:thioredoxin family protein [Priestia megaterium]|uniref:thioredoxin family protein n=1 Tax=Priestia megaterium TaxID=1404 RepID=UPI002877B193|nr:AP2 domain-containing protein [Priestia megaterium]